MGGVRSGVAACVVAAAFSIEVFVASAADTAADQEMARFLLFANADLWRHGGFANGGMLWARNGLDREGLVLKLQAGGGLYRYRSGALGDVEVTGNMLSAAILPGWRFRRDKLIVTWFAGADAQSHRLTPDDPSAGLRGRYLGLRTGFELWYEPDAATMLAADASVSTIGPSYSARAAYGWRLLDRFYLGPEVQGFAADDNYRQVRAGLHLTGFKGGTFEWSAGLGFAADSDRRGSAYGKAGLIARR
jgi:hypothetical protein